MTISQNKLIRAALLFILNAPIWYLMMQLFFVQSGAQGILANPAYQSNKFLQVFMQLQPLPRMATDSSLVIKGFFICGLFMSAAFLMINALLKGGWLKRGLVFGLLQWMLMTPWFEFYLPYNVMQEPLLLVLFEGVLWLATSLATGTCISFIINFRSRS